MPPQAKRQSHLIVLQVPQQGIGCLHSPKTPQCAPITTPFSPLAHGSAPGASVPPLGAVCVVCAHYAKGVFVGRNATQKGKIGHAWAESLCMQPNGKKRVK